MANVLPRSLDTLYRELIDGPDATAAWMLNRGDVGLLGSLDKLSAAAASAAPVAGAASIAAHAEHLRYGLSLMNRWSHGERDPWSTAEWTASWKHSVVNDQEWAALRQALATEARAWLHTLCSPREYDEMELNGVIASVAHL